VFELCPWPNSREHFDRSTALASLRGKRFFAPLARRHPGSTKADVAEVGNVLWADIDDLEARNLINARLRAYHLAPSALVFSGQKGYWVYIKLSVPIPTPQIEHLNKGLATLLDGDRCWNCDRIARLPGSIHPDSGNTAAVVAFSEAVYTQTQLAFLSDLADSAPQATSATTVHATATVRVQFPAAPRLGQRARMYVRQCPRKGEGYDRSKEEQRIFYTLAGQGWTDEQIISFADAHRLPKHEEQRLCRGGYEWTIGSLSNARKALQTCPPSSYGDMCRRSGTKKGSPHLDPRHVLQLVNGQTSVQLRDAVIQNFGGSRRRAYRVIQALRVGGYIKSHGRCAPVTLTDKGHKTIKGKYRRALILPKANRQGFHLR
jgi:hypothetical protein